MHKTQTLAVITFILSISLMSCASQQVAAPSIDAGSITSQPADTPTAQATSTAATSQIQPIATRTPDAALRAPLVMDFGANTTYTDPDGFYTLDYPKKWIVKKSKSEMQFLADQSGEAGIAVSLQIKTLSASSLADDISSLLAARRSGYKEQGRKTSKISGATVVWVDHTYASGSTVYRGFIAASLRNRIGFLIIGWTPRTDYSKYESIFKAMTTSLKRIEYDEAPPYAQWLTHESDHFTFYYLPDTYVAEDIDNIAQDHEQVYADIVKKLKLDFDKPITLFFYPTEDALYRATARKSGHAITEASEVHALWVAEDDHQSLGHEMTHVITAQALGEPTEALLGEGIAVCMDHSGNNPHVTAARLLKARKLVALSDLLGDAWFEQDAEVAYPQSGSFACFLLQKYGSDRFTRIYTASDFSSALKQTYNTDVQTIEKKWLDMLRALK